MLQQVIFVEKTKFVYKLIHSVFKSKQIDCFVVDTDDDFTFQIEDLRPQVIVVNLESVEFEWVARNIQASSYRNFITVALFKQDLDDSRKKIFDHCVKLPIGPYELVKQLKQWSEVN